MREDFLQYVWKYKKFPLQHLTTTTKEDVVIVSVGTHNTNSGPDFFNAQIRINDQLWAGNVEVHLQSSDWYLHNHEKDSAYDNVILHVVWQHDAEIFRNDNSKIPTLELQKLVPKKVVENYNALITKQQKWINCENDFKTIHHFVINNWLERIYLERLEEKSKQLQQLVLRSKNSWEEVLFLKLAENFGLKINTEAFLSIANSIDFSVVLKLQNTKEALEAVLFGQANLLNETKQDVYYNALQEAYLFLKNKFNLSTTTILPLQFFRLRPASFPTIRLSQFANLYVQNKNLFSKVMAAKTLEEFYNLFTVAASKYWNHHYTFGKPSKSSKKQVSKAFIHLLLCNAIIPIKFSYAIYTGKVINSEIIALLEQIPSEKNSIITKFNALQPISKNALQSQALLQLKKKYCDKNKCLQCAIGNQIVQQV